MGTWRAKLSAFFRRWQDARYRARQARDARNDERQAEELEMAKEGLTRRPGDFSF